MDSLEFNLHQLILTDLAKSVSSAPTTIGANHFQNDSEAKSIDTVVDVLSSRVETRVSASPANKVESPDEVDETRVFMSASRVHCNIAFGELAYNVPAAHAAKSVSVLVDILRDIPFIDFESSLAWEEWALPDQLVFSTVSALLRLTAAHLEHRSKVMEAIVQFSLTIVKQLESERPADVITRVGPSFHGLYRAVISTPFP
ncbi:phosphatidylinositol-4- kinase, partial [Tulasnella sp. 331]